MLGPFNCSAVMWHAWQFYKTEWDISLRASRAGFPDLEETQKRKLSFFFFLPFLKWKRMSRKSCCTQTVTGHAWRTRKCREKVGKAGSRQHGEAPDYPWGTGSRPDSLYEVISVLSYIYSQVFCNCYGKHLTWVISKMRTNGLMFIFLITVNLNFSFFI